MCRESTHQFSKILSIIIFPKETNNSPSLLTKNLQNATFERYIITKSCKTETSILPPLPPNFPKTQQAGQLCSRRSKSSAVLRLSFKKSLQTFAPRLMRWCKFLKFGAFQPKHRATKKNPLLRYDPGFLRGGWIDPTSVEVHRNQNPGTVVQRAAWELVAWGHLGRGIGASIPEPESIWTKLQRVLSWKKKVPNSSLSLF